MGKTVAFMPDVPDWVLQDNHQLVFHASIKLQFPESFQYVQGHAKGGQCVILDFSQGSPGTAPFLFVLTSCHSASQRVLEASRWLALGASWVTVLDG